MIHILEVLIGFSSGVIIGAVFISLLIVLNVIPRLIQLGKAQGHLLKIMFAAILGILCGSYFSFTTLPVAWMQSEWVFLPIGLLHGVFNGILIAALAETLNVFPIFTKRLRLEKYLILLLFAIVCGKVFGSLFQWFFIVE